MGYAIVVRYHGPTNAHGGRWVATGPAPHLDGVICEHGPSPRPWTGRRTVSLSAPFDYASHSAGPRRAAERIATALRAHGWRVTVAPGDGYALPDGSGYVYPLAYSSDAE